MIGSKNASKKQGNLFMSWRDLVITPLVWGTTLLDAAGSTMLLGRYVDMTFFAKLTAFYGFLVIWTIVTLAILRLFFPFKAGVISRKRNAVQFYVWNLYGFLSITNLSFQYMNALIPPPFRKIFYQLLGAKMGSGIISIGGRMSEPFMVTIEEGAMIGDDALLIPHAITKGQDEDLLVLMPIKIQSGAIVGAKSIVMPGVTIGENAMVNAMSVVAMNTKIGAGEIWGGVPAVKISGGTTAPVAQTPEPAFAAN